MLKHEPSARSQQGGKPSTVPTDALWRHLAELAPEARIAYHASQRSRWVYATVSKRDPLIDYNHRAVLPSEVVIDLDADTEEANFVTLKKIVNRLSAGGFKYSVWSTGGKGYHIHTFWKALAEVGDARLLKELLFDHLTEKIDGKYDRQLLGNHLVRMEGGLYEKAYPKERRKVMIIGSGEPFFHNEVPECVWEKYGREVLKRAIRQLTPRKGIAGLREMPKCLKYILSPEFKEHRDGGKRALFAVGSYYWRLPHEELVSVLRMFSRYNLKEPMSELELERKAISVKKPAERRVGCQYRHALLREIGAGHVVEECVEQERMRGGTHGTQSLTRGKES